MILNRKSYFQIQIIEIEELSLTFSVYCIVTHIKYDLLDIETKASVWPK